MDPVLARLKEVNYWYWSLKEHESGEEYDAKLRAFAQSAMSVLELLKARYCNRKNPAWKAWYEEARTLRASTHHFDAIDKLRSSEFHTSSRPTTQGFAGIESQDPEIGGFIAFILRYLPGSEVPTVTQTLMCLKGLREMLVEFGPTCGAWSASEVPEIKSPKTPRPSQAPVATLDIGPGPYRSFRS